MNNIDIVSCRLIKDRTLNSDMKINTPSIAVNLILDNFNDLDRECLFVINCDNKLKPNNINIVSVGTVNHTLIDPKEIFKTTILSNSNKIFIMHNHPSEILEPSKQDIAIYKRLKEIGELLEIECIDSIIFNYSKEIYSTSANKILQIGKLEELCMLNKKDINIEEAEEEL